MSNQELLAYVQQQLALGVSLDELRTSLISVGWAETDIDEALNEAVSLIPTQKEIWYKKLLRKKFLISTVATVLLVFFGGGYFTYAYFSSTPEKIIDKALVATSKTTSLEYSGNIRAEITGGSDVLTFFEKLLPNSELAIKTGKVAGEQIFQIPPDSGKDSKTYSATIDFEGGADIKDLNNPKSKFSISFIYSGLIFKLETIAVDKTAFVKLDEFPNLGFIDLSAYLNQWIKFDSEFINQYFEKSQIEDAKKIELTPGQEQEIRDLVNQYSFFKEIKKVSEEAIDGIKCNHYQLVFDKDKFTEYLKQVIEIVNEGKTTESSKSLISEAMQMYEFKNFEVWVGKKDFLVRKLIGGLSISNVESTPDVSIKLDFIVNFKNYNQPVNIIAPASYRTSEQITQDFEQSSQIKIRDARRMADVLQLRAGLELYRDQGFYPKKLEDLKIAEIMTVPLAPTPADGTCLPTQNEYTYQQLENGKNYSLTFCLGEKKGDLQPGVHILNPDTGIK